MQQRSELIGEPRPGLNQRLPHIELHPHPSLLVASSVRRFVRPKLARLCQTPRVPLVRLELLAPRCIHRRKVRVCDDDLHSHRLNMPRHPLAGSTGLQQNFGPPIDEYGIL